MWFLHKSSGFIQQWHWRKYWRKISEFSYFSDRKGYLCESVKGGRWSLKIVSTVPLNFEENILIITVSVQFIFIYFLCFYNQTKPNLNALFFLQKTTAAVYQYKINQPWKKLPVHFFLANFWLFKYLGFPDF